MSSAPVNTSSDLNAIAIQNLIKLIKEDTVPERQVEKRCSAADWVKVWSLLLLPSWKNELKDVDD
jgi:hypothetical protein